MNTSWQDTQKTSARYRSKIVSIFHIEDWGIYILASLTEINGNYTPRYLWGSGEKEIKWLAQGQCSNSLSVKNIILEIHILLRFYIRLLLFYILLLFWRGGEGKTKAGKTTTVGNILLQTEIMASWFFIPFLYLSASEGGSSKICCDQCLYPVDVYLKKLELYVSQELQKEKTR